MRLLCALSAAMLVGMALPPTAAAQLSSDVSLAGLSITSDLRQTRMFPAFDRDVERYDVAVPSGETEVTVSVGPNHSGATMEFWAPGIGSGSNIYELEPDSITGDYTVELRTDRYSYLGIDVTAEDGTEKRYFVSLDAASSEEKGWRVYNDLPLNRLVDDPRLPSHYVNGLWADDSRVLVTAFRHDPLDQKLYAFSAADGSRRLDEEFVLSGRPGAGIWSDGINTLWAMDTDGALRAYNLSDGSEIGGLSTDVSPDGSYDTREMDAPRGIWSDGDTLWVVDRDNAKVFAFALPGTSCSQRDNYCRQSSKDFELSDGNDDPWGITANNGTFWVSDLYDRKLYAYDQSDGSRDLDKDFDLKTLKIINQQQFYYGLAATDTIMYVVEFITNRVYSFHMPGVSGPVAPALVSNDATLRSLSLTDVSPDISQSFASTQTVYSGSVSHDVNSTTVTAEVSDSDASYEVRYVVNGADVVAQNRVVPLAYNDNNTYNVIKVVVTAQDGITKTYRVTVTRPRPLADATLSGLTLSGVDFRSVSYMNQGFSSGDTEYSATVANSLTETTVVATNDSNATSVVIKHNGEVVDANNNGDHVVTLVPEDEGVNTITVEVTAQDGQTTETYTVTVTRDRAKSDVATLMELVLEYENSEDTVALTPEFDGTDTENTRYETTVGHGASTVVVKYETKDQFATAEIREGNAEGQDGRVANERTLTEQDAGAVPLEVDTNTVTVEVTAEDGVTMIAYVVSITRAQPSNDATLESLSFVPGVLSRNGFPVDFAPGEALYDVDVLYDDDSTELSYVKKDGTATVVIKVGGTVGQDDTVTGGLPALHTSDGNAPSSGSVSVPLSTVGTYTVTVEVTAQDATTKNLYVFTVTRPPEPASNVATLGRLRLARAANSREVRLDSPLSDGDIYYEAEVGNTVTSIKVFAEPTDPDAESIELQVGGITDATANKASLKAGHTVSLSEGTTILAMIVTAEDGHATRTYTIQLTRLDRPLPGIATLAELVLKDAAQAELTLDPVFSMDDEPGQDPHATSVDNGVNKVHVTATPTDPKATVEVMVGGTVDENGTIAGETDADSEGFVPLAVASGDNTVRVVVTAQDGGKLTYVLTVTRAAAPTSDVATLSSLTVSDARFTFVTDTISYTLRVGNGVTSTTIRAIATSEAASLTVTLGGASATSKTDVELTAPLEVGDNEIEVVVTAEDPDPQWIKTYTVTVKRAAPDRRPNPVNSNTGNSNFGGGFDPGGGSSTSGGGTGTDTSEDESDSSGSESETGAPYTDAGDGGSEQEEAINALYGLGVLTGTECEENQICPNDPLSRWVAAVWIVRVLDGEEPAAIEESRFSDVSASDMWEDSHWFAPHVERLAELGITAGCAVEPARFCPDDQLTRGQAVTWLHRAFDLPAAASAGFTDTADTPYEDSINRAVAAGIAEGCATNPSRFCTDRVTTRGELASFLNRARIAASSS